MCSFRHWPLVLVLIILAGCGNNLGPSDSDKRPASELTNAVTNTIGPSVGDTAPSFTLEDTNYASVSLSSALAGKKAVVLYFTMWCPICDTHMSDMRDNTIPLFPDVAFYLVDYVSGSVAAARSSQLSNGYGDIDVLADVDQTVLGLYSATMGSTVVINSGGVVLMNEDYNTGSKLRTVLSGLP